MKEFVFSKSTIEFVAVANEFCNVLERELPSEKISFIEKSQKLFALLYLKACFLPKVENEFDEICVKYVAEFDWTHVQNKIATILGEDDVYIEIPQTNSLISDESDTINLSDCFADIYQDLKDFVINYNTGNEEIMNEALWEINDVFRNLMGQKIIQCMSNLHTLFYNSPEDEAEETFY